MPGQHIVLVVEVGVGQRTGQVQAAVAVSQAQVEFSGAIVDGLLHQHRIGGAAVSVYAGSDVGVTLLFLAGQARVDAPVFIDAVIQVGIYALAFQLLVKTVQRLVQGSPVGGSQAAQPVLGEFEPGATGERVRPSSLDTCSCES